MMTGVMLIDQKSLFQKAFRKIIDSLDDFKLVGIAENSNEAIDIFNQTRPQVVFADVVVGHESGISICQKIKEMVPSTLVYILTNYCSLSLVRDWKLSGLDEYILKPISRSRIASLLLSSLPSEEVTENAYSFELIAAIDDRDYKKAYNLVQSVTDQVFEAEDSKERRKIFESIATDLMYQIPGMDRSQMNYYLKKFELTNRILEKNMLCYCWLADIVTEVFRQLCVFKYTHMNQALQYIETHKNYEISITELAAEAQISSGYLSRIFKKYYHISVVDYIHLRKLHKAKQYMVKSDMNISDISFLLGYSEAGYFCKVFKKYEGITPSAFISRYNKK